MNKRVIIVFFLNVFSPTPSFQVFIKKRKDMEGKYGEQRKIWRAKKGKNNFGFPI